MQIILFLIQQIGVFDMVETFLYVIGSILSAVLVALSLSAYRSSGLENLKYAIIAFALFCMFLIYEILENLFSIESPFTDIVIPLSALAILLFLFLAIIKKSLVNKKQYQ